jgi:hypothetical protein
MKTVVTLAVPRLPTLVAVANMDAESNHGYSPTDEERRAEEE